MSAAIEVKVQYAAGRAGVPSGRSIAGWARAALAGRRRGGAQLVVRIVGEDEGRELNGRYRGRKGATNVLSFPYDGPAVLTPPLLGDIVICAPVVGREAQAQGKVPVAHWAHLVVHGVLHLLGHDHEDEREAVAMEAIETDVLASLGFPDPYAAERVAVAARPKAVARGARAGR
jgi:probable rRNA maturation factor